MTDLSYEEARQRTFIPKCSECGWMAEAAWLSDGEAHANRELLRHLRDEHGALNEHLAVEDGPEIVETSCVDCEDLGIADWCERLNRAEAIEWAIKHAREEQHEVTVNLSRDTIFHGELIKR